LIARSSGADSSSSIRRAVNRYYANALTGKVVTCVPMHSGDIKRPLLKKIIQDVGLTNFASFSDFRAEPRPRFAAFPIGAKVCRPACVSPHSTH
jgi:hypothetical protein